MWHDGLITKTVRTYAQESNDNKKWAIIDGPIDAIWVENLNMVLDDNRTLMFSNGKSIWIDFNTNFFFEVADLAVASPATVSRCGMVYFDPSYLGWKPFIKTWIVQTFKDNSILNDTLKEYLLAAFDPVVDLGLNKIRNDLKEPLGTVNL